MADYRIASYRLPRLADKDAQQRGLPRYDFCSAYLAALQMLVVDSCRDCRACPVRRDGGGDRHLRRVRLRPAALVSSEHLLAEALGGEWMRWEYGPAGVPGGVMWTRFAADNNDHMVLTGLVVIGDGLTAESLRRIPVSVIERAMAEKVAGDDQQRRDDLAKLPRLERGSLSAVEFSQLVADHYKVWARYMSHPAAGMAAEWGVKSGTIHGWIREARLRGFLPEAERGKRVHG